MAFVAGFDIGGTHTRCAVAAHNAPHEILASQVEATPRQGVASVLDCAEHLLHRCLEKLDGTQSIIAAGCTAPGMTDTERGVIIEAANLPGWLDVPLKKRLRERLSVPVAIANDVNAAALAEALIGAGRGLSPLVYLTISTGVAAGIVIGGEILQGAHYSAGEVGTVIPDRRHLSRDWRPNGCLELTAAGVGLGRIWVDLRGGEPGAHRAREVFLAADAGDAQAIELVNQTRDYLSQGAVAIASVLDPACIVIGGSIGLNRPAIRQRMQEVLEASLRFPPAIIPATLGGEAPLIGAMYLAALLADS